MRDYWHVEGCAKRDCVEEEGDIPLRPSSTVLA
jgi:hypothetical protein